MVTLLEGMLVVHSQGVSSNVRGENTPRGADKTLARAVIKRQCQSTEMTFILYYPTVVIILLTRTYASLSVCVYLDCLSSVSGIDNSNTTVRMSRGWLVADTTL